MGDEEVLDFLRVDVHPARDDHVALAVGQEQVAVGIDIPDVAERRPRGVPGIAALAGLGLVPEVPEIHPTLEIDDSLLTGRKLLAAVVADVQRAPGGPADRARLIKPLLRGDPGRAVAFGAAVVL